MRVEEAPAANEVMPAALVEPVLEEGQVTDPDCDDWVKLEANFMTGRQYMVDGVTVDVYDDGMGQEFDFSSERRVCKVYVKGGPDTNVYTYDPGVFEDEGLHAPFNPGSEKWYDLSNIIFCFCPDEPVVEIDLSIVKEADVETVLPGGLINYTITVCNESTTTCEDVELVDDFDEDAVTVSNISDGGFNANGEIHWPAFDLDPEECRTFTYTAEVGEDVDPGYEVCNVATATCEGIHFSDDACVLVVAPPEVVPGLEVEKSANKEIAAPGETADYTIVVTSPSEEDAEDVLVTDDYDERFVDIVAGSITGGGAVVNGTIVWTIDVPAGESVTLMYRARVKDDVVGGTIIRNIVTVEDVSDFVDVRVVVPVTPAVREEFVPAEPFLPFTGGEAMLLGLAVLASAGAGAALRKRARTTRDRDAA
ncbi:MAG: DUF11 domain-containing protein [Coriobacteriia bacterium]|nr:DUF11 domain-containing protein [Coriobacteriia bacterium]